MRQRVLVGFVALGLCAQAHAQSLEIGLNDDTARVRYSTAMWGEQYGRAQMEVGALYSSEYDNHLLNAGLLVFNDSWESPLELGVGGRFYFADTDADTFGGLALGGQFRFAPLNWRGFGIGAQYFYAPDIVTFSDAENLSEFGARVDYELMPQARVFIAYHNIEADHEDYSGSVELDEATLFGVSMRW